MPAVAIRQLHGDEAIDTVFPLTAYAFTATPPLPDLEERRAALRQREGVSYFALFEDGAAVACAAGIAMTQHVRGRLLPAGGVWGVATAPVARQKGYAKRLMGTLHAHMRDLGQPLACLYPFRESFYERLGYATFPLVQKVRFRPEAARSLLQRDLAGHVARLPLADGHATYRAFLDRLRRRCHGLALYDHWSPGLASHYRYWLAVASVDDEPAALMVYDLKGETIGDFKLRAIHFYHLTAQGKYLLLAWIARHTDQAGQAELWLAPGELPETWLADLKIEREAPVRAPMGRVLDVTGLDGLNTGPGAFVARVRDPACPWNEGVWSFATHDGRLRVEAAKRADCDLSIQALSALVYGTHDPADFAWRGWSDAGPEALAAMGAMFSREQPHLHEMF